MNGENTMSSPLPARSLKAFAVCFLLLFGILFYSGYANAANLVSGRYVSATGTKIVLSLSIQNPPPLNLIVEQYLSPGNSIVATSPQAKKISTGKGKCKWLFRNTRSGKITVSIQLKAPLKGSVRAMIRYREPNGGKFTELQISP
jgi:hypothetical protein